MTFVQCLVKTGGIQWLTLDAVSWTENPRVVGSIPTLATIFKHLAATRGFPLLYRCTSAPLWTLGGCPWRARQLEHDRGGPSNQRLARSLVDVVAGTIAFARPHADSMSACQCALTVE